MGASVGEIVGVNGAGRSLWLHIIGTYCLRTTTTFFESIQKDAPSLLCWVAFLHSAGLLFFTLLVSSSLLLGS